MTRKVVKDCAFLNGSDSVYLDVGDIHAMLFECYMKFERWMNMSIYFIFLHFSRHPFRKKILHTMVNTFLKNFSFECYIKDIFFPKKLHPIIIPKWCFPQ